MTKDQIKEYIVKIINDRQGCKAMELVLDHTILSAATEPYQGGADKFDFLELMSELIAEGKVIEIEYVLSNMNYRAKSFYLPANTKVSVFPKSEAVPDAQ
jgi:hypothetical protein